jgi:hypothetical protein
VAGQGTTDNLMDYTTGNKTILYKHQWDLVHDPETMLFAGREDADEVLEIGKTLPAINLSQYQGYAFLTPSGDAITINGINEGTFNYDGGLLNFTLNNNTKIYGIFVKDPDEKFIGYYTSEVLSTFRDNNTFSEKLVLGDKATLDKLNEYLFTNYSFAKINSPVFATAKIITNGKYSDCYCYYKWANIKQSNSLTTVVSLPIIPSGAQKIGFATDCNAEMYASLYEIQQGIGNDVFISLFDITPNDKIDHLADLCIWLTKLCGDKRYGFYVEKYKNSTDFKDFIKYLQENKIYTRQHFEQIFTQLSCSDYGIVFSETDLWKDIDRETYNLASVDWTSYSLPVISNEDELYEALDRLEFIISEIKNDAPTAIAEKSYNNLVDYISECADDPEKALSNILHLNQTFKTIHAYLGMYSNYEYSLSDLVVRHSLKQQGNFWRVIKDSELRGEAAPVSSTNDYNQYLAYYDTESAYFIGEKFQGMMGTIYALYGLSQGINAMGGAARAISQHRATFKIAINRNNLLNTRIQYNRLLTANQRLPQDIRYQQYRQLKANGDAPATKNWQNQRIGTDPVQNQIKDAFAIELYKVGITEYRVNQTQSSAANKTLGLNRPDIQFTFNRIRYYIEIDAASSNRGLPHLQRITANDPSVSSRTLPTVLQSIRVTVNGQTYQLTGGVTLIQLP